jgi:GMP synthase-like glutamine amidotransferase
VRVVAFRHSPLDGLGWIAPALEAHGFHYAYADLFVSSAPVSGILDADALIFLGGSMSANDDLPAIHREIEYIRAAISLWKPVLGVCLGAQLIAKALGARVYPNNEKEIGWAPVMFTDAAQGDSLFADVSGSEVVFHWHGETFELPGAAELLASSLACRHQAFRHGDRIYGLQFHLEVTPAMITQWCREDEACGEAREAKEAIDPYAHAARAEELAGLIFGRWCALADRQVQACLPLE